eukprot:397664-Karenia_brevis.AAC.1
MPGARPWSNYYDEYDDNNQPVLTQLWRTKFLNAEVLLNYFTKVMGPSSFTPQDREDFLQRHQANDPA